MDVGALKRRLVLEPGDVEARFALAELLFGQRDLTQARSQLEKLLVHAPAHAGALRLLARVCRAQGEAGAARRTLLLLASVSPDDADTHDTLAEAFIGDQRPDDALVHAREALRLGVWAPQRVLRCVQLARATGRLELARAFAERGLLRDPSERELRLARQWLLDETGAEDAFDLLSVLERGDPLFAVREALIAEDLSAARRALVACAAEHGERPEFHQLRGELMLLEGHDDRARAAFLKARERTPLPLVTGELAQRVRRGHWRRLGVLGWSPAGGAVSPLEVVAVSGRGELHFSGNVHGTGLEAARLAFSLVKSRARQWDPRGALARTDFQLNFTDIELGKEGLSSGVALTLGLHAALQGRRLPPRVAVTGAVSLGGEALRIAGVHEKLTAVALAGWPTVIVPRANRADVEALPAVVRRCFEVHLVSTVDEAIAVLATFPA
ncbi:MAG: S16 family serine protease [Myxococcota bacterium]